VSAFPTLEGLYHYMIAKNADLTDCRVVELGAELADDVDFDADQGALLVIPITVRAETRADPALARRIATAAERLD
jgi:hypothetical protein